MVLLVKLHQIDPHVAPVVAREGTSLALVFCVRSGGAGIGGVHAGVEDPDLDHRSSFCVGGANGCDGDD